MHAIGSDTLKRKHKLKTKQKQKKYCQTVDTLLSMNVILRDKSSIVIRIEQWREFRFDQWEEFIKYYKRHENFIYTCKKESKRRLKMFQVLVLRYSTCTHTFVRMCTTIKKSRFRTRTLIFFWLITDEEEE